MRPTGVPGYLALESSRRWPQGVISSGWPRLTAPLLSQHLCQWKSDPRSGETPGSSGVLLGWKPTFTFRDFYENLKAGKYPKDYVFPYAD